MTVYLQQFWNDRLWHVQEQFHQIFFEGQNVSASCMDQARFAGCYYTFPGCDRSTSVFRPKQFCKESCLHFTNECSASFKQGIDVSSSFYPGKEALFNCSKKTSRNAGDSPGCLYYHRKKSLEREGMLVGHLVTRISGPLSGGGGGGGVHYDVRSVLRSVIIILTN